MEKKYQVFVSSTFRDLSDERKKVLDLLLMTDCIPAGMESFVATDDEQFNVIKKVIDLCDYYILIIGRMYGTLNNETGKSYTEMEYDYAISKKIPVLVFTLDDSVEIDQSKCETDETKKKKLIEFKSRAMQNRLASIWRDKTDLIGKVTVSIMRAKSEIERPGWHRGNEISQKALVDEIIELKTENANLKKQLNESQISTISDGKDSLNNLPFTDHKIKLHYTKKVYVFTANTKANEIEIEVTLDKLFQFISLRLTGKHIASDFIKAVSDYRSGYYVDTQQALIVKNHYIQLGLLRSLSMKQKTEEVEMIELTEKGIKIMNELNAIK
ncbi:MAG: DUF4062 domain-containing protein [Bacteroidales bacterium]|nr:DUF4062 domain-containing protein [Bacteroidales bacterium]